MAGKSLNGTTSSSTWSTLSYEDRTYHYICVVCGRTGKVLYCDYGSNPTLHSFLEGDWKCPSCVYNKTSPMKREDAENDTKRFNPDLVYSRRKKNRSQDGTHA